MRFEHFQTRMQALADLPHPGVEAHELIFPKIVHFREEALKKDPSPRQSAVAAIFFPTGDECSLLLIERQTYDGVHSAQIGFPGGKVEEEDESFESTARRETEEECGIPGESLQLLRTLTHVYIPPSRFLVHPFVFSLNYTPELELDEREVQRAIVMPVSVLLDEASLKSGEVTLDSGYSIQTNYFDIAEKKIWGATAMMLSELKVLLKQI